MAETIFVIQIVFFALLVMARQSVAGLGDWLFPGTYVSCLLGTVQNVDPPLLPTCLLWGQPLFRRDDYTYTPGIGGHKLHTRAVVWNEARLTCEEEGGHLAIINSIAEANAIAEIYGNSEAIIGSPHPQYAIVGFHDLWNEGDYTTIHGQSLARAGYTQWGAGQPDNGLGVEDCGSIDKSGRLNDIPCEIKYGFVCEIPIY